MNGWIVFAAIASMAITALLTWLLYRLNATTAAGDGDLGDGDGGD